MKKYLPFLLIACGVVMGYWYFALAKDINYLPDNRAVITNRWTGEVLQCIVASGAPKNWVCKEGERISVPWYMEMVQNTFDIFN